MAAKESTSKRLPVAERRAQLLEVGRRIFNEHHFGEVAVGQIADEVGISTGLLYHYFPTKLDFFVACASCELDEFLERLATTRRHRSVPARLDAALDAYVEFVSSESGGIQNVLRLAGAHPEVAAVLDRLRDAVASEIRDALGFDDSPTLRTALVGFQGYAEAATLDWISHRDAGIEVVKSLLANCLAHSLATAGALDGSPLPRRTLKSIATG